VEDAVQLQGAMVDACGLVSGLTSVPLTYYAVRCHREVHRLHRANRSLRRVLVAHQLPARTPRPHGRHVQPTASHRSRSRPTTL
jgi:hypothetical protein